MTVTDDSVLCDNVVGSSRPPIACVTAVATRVHELSDFTIFPRVVDYTLNDI